MGTYLSAEKAFGVSDAPLYTVEPFAGLWAASTSSLCVGAGPGFWYGGDSLTWASCP